MGQETSASFEVGDRVQINYGPGTVVSVIPSEGREPLIVVHADVGQAWFRLPSEVSRLSGGESDE